MLITRSRTTGSNRLTGMCVFASAGSRSGRQAAPKAWADAYLAAFADASELTRVTFDLAFRGKVKPLILLAG